MKILIIVQAYPQISETYIKTEIEKLSETHEVEIVALSVGDYPYRNRFPHIQLTNANEKHIIEYIKNFSPDIIHGHYLMNLPIFFRLSQVLNRPFTFRSHSFDVLGKTQEQLQSVSQFINHENCLGMLGFPFLRRRLEAAGIRSEKFVDCFPVVKHTLFDDRSKNGSGVMNVGAALPKKNMNDFFRLSKLRPEKQFNLYALGYKTKQLMETNKELDGRVNFIPPVEPDDMLKHYKQHEWLVYTASSVINKVGWPLAVAEAQASGVGVCMQTTRPDLIEYVGDAGFVFNKIEEAAEIIAQPFPDVLRERGFVLSKRSDVNNHISCLTDLWQ
jgi:glycosyltransferase involved in cell wall biosynthesis